MASIEDYAAVNAGQEIAEHDSFSVERYRQIARCLPARAVRIVLDVGCANGRGGAELHRLQPWIILHGVDVMPSRLEALPAAYAHRHLGSATDLPVEDGSMSVVVAAELVEHLRPHDVDAALCEFQRVLCPGGLLFLTTPNPDSYRLRVKHGTVYTVGHLTQHHAPILRRRLLAHGFRTVKVRGTGKTSRYVGTRFPARNVYGSYLLIARK